MVATRTCLAATLSADIEKSSQTAVYAGRFALWRAAGHRSLDNSFAETPIWTIVLYLIVKLIANVNNYTYIIIVWVCVYSIFMRMHTDSRLQKLSLVLFDIDTTTYSTRLR